MVIFGFCGGNSTTGPCTCNEASLVEGLHDRDHVLGVA